MVNRRCHMLLCFFLVLSLLFQPVVLTSVYGESNKTAENVSRLETTTLDTLSEGLEAEEIDVEPSEEDYANLEAAEDEENLERAGKIKSVINKAVSYINEAKSNVRLMTATIKTMLEIIKYVRNPAKSIFDSATTFTKMVGNYHKTETMLDLLLAKASEMATYCSMAGVIMAEVGVLTAATGVMIHVGATFGAIGVSLLTYARTARFLIGVLKGGIVLGRAANAAWQAAVNKVKSWWSKRKTDVATGIENTVQPPELDDIIEEDLLAEPDPDESEIISEPDYLEME